LTGTAAPGSSVSVAIGDATYDAAVANDGTWSVTYPATDFPNGEYELTAIATATDAVGNVATASHTFDVDTYVNDLTKTGGPVGGDGVINIAEAAEGVSLTGTVEPGSTVQVTLGAVTLPAVVQPNGDWSVAFNGAQIPTGETPTTLTIDATDAAQNTTSISETVQIDRDAGFLTLSADPIEGDDVINFDEASDGVVLYGTATPEAVVNVTLGGVEHTAVSDVNGTWTTTYLPTEVAGGTYPSSITATTTDSAGNTLSVADSVRVDTVVDNLGIQQPIEGDNIISQSDAANGVLISGTSEVGSTVVVAFGTSSLTTVADGNGNWNVTFPASAVPAAEIASTAVTATATDLAGNVRDVSANVRIDTIVSNMSISGTAVEGDNVVNASEYSDGVVLNGTTEIGSTVSVAINGVSQQATVAPNGDWSISFDPATLPLGDYTANVVVTATDAVGNVKSLNTSFDVDTQAPDAPLIRSFDKDARDGVVEIGTETTTDTFTITEITAGGSANNVTFTQTENTLRDRTDFEFTHGVPDGSQLVVTADDASGNSNSTLFVLDDVATDIVDLNVAALGQFDIGSINLSLAEDSQLTITADDLESLSSNSNTVRINGGSDDTVNIQGAVRANTTETINGQTFDVYSLGNEGGSLVINEDINVII
ncbi:MAG: Ig-like domain-containing protein, partial [Nereida ignava]